MRHLTCQKKDGPTDHCDIKDQIHRGFARCSAREFTASQPNSPAEYAQRGEHQKSQEKCLHTTPSEMKGTTMNLEALQAQIDNLNGRLTATQSAVRALIACHPNPEKAIEIVAEHLDRYAGLALAKDVPDELADAISNADKHILPTDEEIERAQR